jgi:hypothetical protein
MDNFLFYRLHHAGLTNRLFSLEVGLGLSYITNKKLVIYNLLDSQQNWLDSFPISDNVVFGKRDSIVKREMVNFFELIDFNKSLVWEYIAFGKIDQFSKDEIKISDNLFSDYVNVSKEIQVGAEYFNKKELIFEENKSYNMSGPNLANRETFFANQDNEFLNKIKVTFKEDYINLANKIANSLGEFRGMHVRLTDHAERTFSFSEKDFDKALKNNDLKTVVLTDDVNNEIFKNKDITFLDDYIVDNFSDEFLALPSQSEIVFGLIGLLVMCQSKEFIGTPRSTFTAYIQRDMISSKKSDVFSFIGYDDFAEFPKDWV